MKITPPPFDVAACEGADDAVFFPDPRATATLAKRICAGCPSRAACLEWAMRLEADTAPRWGVFGGLTADERRELGKRWVG